MGEKTSLCIDLGSTKIEICRIAPTGEICSRTRFSTATLEPGSPDFLERVSVLIETHLSHSDQKLGVSWNAPIHHERLTYSTLLGGECDVNFGTFFRQRFALEVQVESDVHAMALGEFRFGSGPGSAPFVFVNLGSGSGFAFHDGVQLMRGYQGCAGLVCHEKRMVSEIGEPVIMDNLLSGRGLSLLYRKIAGETISAHEVVDRLPDDSLAQRALSILGHHLGHFMTTLARFFNPRSIILGGSVSCAHQHFLPVALETMSEHIERMCRPEKVFVSEIEAPACRGLS